MSNIDNLSDFYRQYGTSLADRLRPFVHPSDPLIDVFVEDIDNPVELLSAISSGQVPDGQPVFVWDNFEETLQTSGRDNYHLVLRGSLSILQKGTDSAGRSAAYRAARTAVLKTLSLMIQDSEDGSLWEETISVDLRQFPLQKVGPVSATWYGYGAEFSWTVPIDLTLTAGPPDAPNNQAA